MDSTDYSDELETVYKEARYDVYVRCGNEEAVQGNRNLQEVSSNSGTVDIQP